MTINKEQVHVVTSVERRRRWSPQEKQQIVEETYQPGASLSQVARKYGINPSQVFTWRRWTKEGGKVNTLQKL
jgi:transposase